MNEGDIAPNFTVLDNSLNQITLDDYKNDKTVTGIIIQQPLPKHLDMEEIIEQIDPDKDVEGLHPTNIGKLFSGSNTTVDVPKNRNLPFTAGLILK